MTTELEALRKVADAARKVIAIRAWNHDEDHDARRNYDHAADEIRKTLAALDAAEPAEWRPIEDAPRDGTMVWVYTAPIGPPKISGYLAGFQCPCAYHPDAGWCTDELREVTHWVPLECVDLAPPSAASEADGLTSDETDAISREVEMNIGFDEGAGAERAAIVACLFAFAQSAEDEQVGRSDWAIIYRSAAEAIRDGAHEWIERGDHIQPEPTAPEEVHGDLDASPPPAVSEEGEQ